MSDYCDYTKVICFIVVYSTEKKQICVNCPELKMDSNGCLNLKQIVNEISGCLCFYSARKAAVSRWHRRPDVKVKIFEEMEVD